MTTTYEPNVVLETGKYNVVGTRPIRHDGADKVTGRALYGGDFNAAGLLHAAVLRSPHAHARIRSIDTSKASELPGVHAVATGSDLPGASFGQMVDTGEGAVDLYYMQSNAMAVHKVLYKGHAVAAVAAASPHIAQEALDLIEVEYEPLPAVLTAPEAMKDGAPILIDELRTSEMGETGAVHTNVAEHFQHRLGDVDEGFAKADIVIEKEFNTETVHQGYIEPQNVTALWNEDGRLHIWTSSQGPFEVRAAVAQSLDIPVSQVKVTPMEIGGGFGGKFPLHQESITALLSKQAGRPV